MAVDYNEPLLMTYTWTAQAFGGSTITKKVRAPAGKKARVFDCNVLPTVTFAGSTTPPLINVGDAGSATRILNAWSMGLTAAGTLVTKPTDTQMQRLGANVANWAYVDVNTDILIALTTGVGTPAGTADVSITFAFY